MNKIIFLLATAREGSVSQKAAQFVLACAQKRMDIEPVFVDIKDHLRSQTQGPVKDQPNKWEEQVKSAQGLVIISPEYNHGYPGELKLLLDSAYDAYYGKPVAICAVSNGPVGGARMAEQLKLVMLAFQTIIINAAVYFANDNDIFTADGQVQNADFWEKRVDGMLDQLIAFIK